MKPRCEPALAQERGRLENTHRRELQAPRGRAPAEVRKRQEQELRAFERHARQQRQVLEERLRKRLYDQRASGPRGKEKDREGGRGKSRGRDSRG